MTGLAFLTVQCLILHSVHGFARPSRKESLWGRIRLERKYNPEDRRQYCYTSDDSQQTRAMIDLLLDLECEGIGDDGMVEIGFGPNQGIRGVFAKESLSPGEYICAVPFPAALKITHDEPDSMTDAQRGLLFLQNFQSPNTSSMSSHWRSYLDCLPTREYCFDPTPDFWTKDEIQALEFPRIVHDALTRKREIELLAEKAGVTMDELQFATWLVKSRSFTTIRIKDKDSVQTSNVIIPFFDMINHSSDDPNAELQVIETKIEEESFYALCATCPIATGQEVLISYGTTCDSSVELLMNYGLVQTWNQFDAEMLRQGGNDCFNAVDDWRTTLQQDEEALRQTLPGSVENTILAFRVRLKRAIQEMSDSW